MTYKKKPPYLDLKAAQGQNYSLHNNAGKVKHIMTYDHVNNGYCVTYMVTS